MSRSVGAMLFHTDHAEVVDESEGAEAVESTTSQPCEGNVAQHADVLRAAPWCHIADSAEDAAVEPQSEPFPWASPGKGDLVLKASNAIADEAGPSNDARGAANDFDGTTTATRAQSIFVAPSSKSKAAGGRHGSPGNGKGVERPVSGEGDAEMPEAVADGGGARVLVSRVIGDALQCVSDEAERPVSGEGDAEIGDGGSPDVLQSRGLVDEKESGKEKEGDPSVTGGVDKDGGGQVERGVYPEQHGASSDQLSRPSLDGARKHAAAWERLTQQRESMDGRAEGRAEGGGKPPRRLRGKGHHAGSSCGQEADAGEASEVSDRTVKTFGGRKRPTNQEAMEVFDGIRDIYYELDTDQRSKIAKVPQTVSPKPRLNAFYDNMESLMNSQRHEDNNLRGSALARTAAQRFLSDKAPV